MFRWEPEGLYCCTKSMASTPFWFSMEHLWIAFQPFWFSADETFCHRMYNSDIAYNQHLQTYFRQIVVIWTISAYHFSQSLKLWSTQKFLIFNNCIKIITFFYVIWCTHCNLRCTLYLQFIKLLEIQVYVSSDDRCESQKGIITIQRCSVANQKGNIAVQSLWRIGDSALLVLNGTLLNSVNALLVLNGTLLNSVNALLVLNGTLLNSVNALLVLSWQHARASAQVYVCFLVDWTDQCWTCKKDFMNPTPQKNISIICISVSIFIHRKTAYKFNHSSDFNSVIYILMCASLAFHWWKMACKIR